jgi:hypothetical protein
VRIAPLTVRPALGIGDALVTLDGAAAAEGVALGPFGIAVLKVT